MRTRKTNRKNDTEGIKNKEKNRIRKQNTILPLTLDTHRNF